MALTFLKTPEVLLDKFKALEAKGKYPKRKSMLVPALHIAQDYYGWISEDAIAAVADFLDLPTVYVKADASFYSMFFLEKPCKYVIQVCHNVSCYLNGAEEIVQYLEKKLNIKCGHTTEDGKFSLITVECLAACGRGPVVQINNHEYHEEMTIAKVDALIDSLEQ